MTTQFNCLIMGAAGRDFHDFLMFFRDRPEFHVCAFTAAQIPFIEKRAFPRSLAGPLYHADIPIFPESELPELINRFDLDFVFLAYSDLSHEDVMHKASLVESLGASFVLLGPKHTQLCSSKPVIAVTAVRTGAGKSPLAQWLADHLTRRGVRAGIIRHPMPYGDLERQAVERFASMDDLDRLQCTVEEREEYEPYIERGLVIYAGVDYGSILAQAEAESDVILWDGGNNDYSFICPDLSITVVDPLRAGHEVRYHPGEMNLRSADVIVIAKVGQARPEDLAAVRENVKHYNPSAEVIEYDLEIEVADPSLITGRRVLVVEDGPTLTHGGMSFGAGTLAARRYGAAHIVDPRPSAVGSIAAAYAEFPHLQNVLPALGYSESQCAELQQTILSCAADTVIDASPARLERVLDLDIPVAVVRYRFQQVGGRPLSELVDEFLGSRH
jgi:predicted GTPase